MENNEKQPIGSNDKMTSTKTTIKISEYYPHTLSEYFDIIEEINKKNPKKTILFRGQSQDYDLIPSIARKDRRNNTAVIEEEVLFEFKRRSRLKIASQLIDDWDWLVYAQHFGLKTRLLDWSSNPLVGLWFSCNNKFDWDKNGVVYVFTVDREYLLDRNKNESPFNRNTTRVYKPHLNNDRILAQSGWFTAHGYSTKNKKFYPLNKSMTFKKYLNKVIIDNATKEELFDKLNVLGVNYEKLFPDIEGICKQINHENKL